MATWTCPTELSDAIAAGSAPRTIYTCRHVAFDVLAPKLDCPAVCMIAESDCGEEAKISDRATLHEACAHADCIVISDRNGFRAPYRLALVS